jgi:tetratricopeptide (TPR) repeat protein
MARVGGYLFYVFLALTWAGALAVSGRFSDPPCLKAPLMVIGLAGLALLNLNRLTRTFALMPFLFFWMYAYFRLSRTVLFQEAAVLHMGVFFAFLVGYLRVPCARPWATIWVIWLCVARGVIDLATLSPLGGATDPSGFLAPLGTVSSFFGNKHTFGGLLVLGAFHHFYRMEKGEPHKPVQALLYTSTLLVLLSLILAGSRLAQGAFFLCFLPLLFLSLRLDGKEPAPERLVWITGITLCLGLAWINLPERQLQKMALLLSTTAPQSLLWAWGVAWRVFLTFPAWGAGTGSFRFSALHFAGSRPLGTDNASLPRMDHAGSHFLESLAESGSAGTAMEIILLIVALVAMALFYYREWRIESKYAFFSLAALILMGTFCPILEEPPARFIYWGLIGYGLSLSIEAWGGWWVPLKAQAHPRAEKVARWTLASVLVALSVFHLVERSRELRSDLLYVRAHYLAGGNPRASTDLLVQALAVNPLNEDANYAYAEVLAHFHKEEAAVKLLSFIQTFAPDPARHAEALSGIYDVMGRADSAALYAGRVLSGHPHYLPALEILSAYLNHNGLCPALDSLLQRTVQLENLYPLPASKEYTIETLDSLFGSNEDLNFLQKWFGGKALRRRFVERQMLAYNVRFQNHSRAMFIRDTHCAEPDTTAAPDTLKFIPRKRPQRKWRMYPGIG